MIKKLLNFFEQNLSPAAGIKDTDHRLKLASASLLIEMVRMDHQIEQVEHDTVKSLLQNNYALSDQETESLFELAEEESKNAVDYYRFAKLINEHYSQSQKIQIVENLWLIANADGIIDKYEEHYLRKVADLLHVPHREFIKAKHRIVSDE